MRLFRKWRYVGKHRAPGFDPPSDADQDLSDTMEFLRAIHDDDGSQSPLEAETLLRPAGSRHEKETEW